MVDKKEMFKPFKITITVDDPEEGEQFLRGLILAKQNNSSEYFPLLIDGVNDGLQRHRKAVLDAQLAARTAAGMP